MLSKEVREKGGNMSIRKFMVAAIVVLYGLVLISHPTSTGTVFSRIAEAAEIYTSSNLCNVGTVANPREDDGKGRIATSDSSEGFTAGVQEGCVCPALEQYIITGYANGGVTEFIKEENIPDGLTRGTIHCDTWGSVCSRHYSCPVLYPVHCQDEQPRRFTNADGDCCIFIWGTWRRQWSSGLAYYDENFNQIAGPSASGAHSWTKVDYVVCPTFSIDIDIAGTVSEEDDVVCVGGSLAAKACLSGPSEATQDVTFSVDPSAHASVSPTSITMTVGTEYDLTLTGLAASSTPNDTLLVAEIGSKKLLEEDFTVVRVDSIAPQEQTVLLNTETEFQIATTPPDDFYSFVSITVSGTTLISYDTATGKVMTRFEQPSASETDYKTVTATCGTTSAVARTIVQDPYKPPEGKFKTVNPSTIYVKGGKYYSQESGSSGLKAISLVDIDRDPAGNEVKDTFDGSEAIHWTGANSYFSPPFGKYVTWDALGLDIEFSDIIMSIDDDGNPVDDGGYKQAASIKVYIVPVAEVGAVEAVDFNDSTRRSTSCLQMVKTGVLQSRKASVTAIKVDASIPWGPGEPTWSGDGKQATAGVDSFTWTGRTDANISASAGSTTSSVKVDLVYADPETTDITKPLKLWQKRLEKIVDALKLDKEYWELKPEVTASWKTEWVDAYQSPLVARKHQYAINGNIALSFEGPTPYTLKMPGKFKKYCKGGLFVVGSASAGFKVIEVTYDPSQSSPWNVGGAFVVGGNVGLSLQVKALIPGVDPSGIKASGTGTVGVEGEGGVDKKGVYGQITLGKVDVSVSGEVLWKGEPLFSVSETWHVFEGWSIPEEPKYFIEWDIEE